MIKISTLVFSFILCLGLFAQNKEVSFIEQDIAMAKQKAKDQGKLIFVDAYATWCGPCKWMSANVFTNDTVTEFLNKNFICLKLDMEKGEGIEFRNQYDIRYYPTLLFLNDEGQELHRHLGVSRKMEDYVDLGLLALNPIKRLSAYHNSYDAGNRSPAFLEEYMEQRSKVALSNQEVLTSFYQPLSPEELMSESAWKIIFNYDKSIDSKGMVNLLNKRNEYALAFGQDKVDQRLYQNYLEFLYSKVYTNPFSMKDMELTMIDIKKKQIPYWEKIILLGDLAHLKQAKKYRQYCEVAVEDIGDYFNEDPNALNEFAWNVFQWSKKKKELEVASTWAKRAMELENEPAVIDTYANLQYKLGNKEEARSSQQQAIDMLKKRGEDFSDYQKTLDSFK